MCFTVVAPDGEKLKSIVDGLPRGWVVEPEDAASPAVAGKVQLIQEPDGYRIRSDDGFERSFADAELAIWMLRRHLRDAVCARLQDSIPIRGAFVNFGGKGILLPGHALAGTTCLAEALVGAGGEQYADDVVLITPDGSAWAYGGAAGQAVEGVRAQIGLVAWATYQPAAVWAPSHLSPAEGVANLMAHVAGGGLSAGTLATLRRALTSAVLLRGERGEAEETATALLQGLDPADL